MVRECFPGVASRVGTLLGPEGTTTGLRAPFAGFVARAHLRVGVGSSGGGLFAVAPVGVVGAGPCGR